MFTWNDKRAAKIILGWKTEKGKDASINRILPFLENLQGKVLEIGAGAGNILKYLPPEVEYTCIEPNRYLHEAIREEAVLCGFVEINILGAMAEKMPLPSNSFDAVISVRSLCSMDTAKVLQEIKRVLKPGSKFIFVEHVVAQHGTLLRLAQKTIRYPHKILRGGCDPAKDIEAMIKQVGFTEVKIEQFDVDRDIAKSRIAGTAIK